MCLLAVALVILIFSLSPLSIPVRLLIVIKYLFVFAGDYKNK